MGLLEEARAEQHRKKQAHRPCPVAVVLASMSDKDASELRDVMDDKDIDAPTIAKVLAMRGFEVADRAIQKHRRDSGGRCSCER